MPKQGAKDIIETDLDKLRDMRCVPIAREVLKIIANSDNLALGEKVSDMERINSYEPIFMKIMARFVELDIPLKDVGYIFSLVSQALNFTKDIIENSNDRNTKKADSLLWGKDTDELTFVDVDTVLKKSTVDKVA